MKHCKISGKQRKQFRPLTTNSKHGGRIAPDLVQRKFHPNEQNRTEFGCLMLHSFGLRLVGVISV
ncbi:hypothetical protein LEP1GSC098_0352 [Leptospira interrogans serovar Grippotyphosa str. UI 08434]|nr:hypothetical protein LEP1GSC098_0352 [Leptospira interrogans serovar Grippotyphosa str. UI 08434]